jgi:predicted lipoprotein
MKSRQSAIPVLVIFFIVYLMAGTGCTIVRHDDKAKEGEDTLSIYFDNGEFDAAVYVDSVWEDQVVPRIKEHAVEAEELFSLLESDPERAVEQFGYRIEITAPYNFMVEGSAGIVSANTESAAATISLDLNGPDGKPVEIQIGPVLKGTAVRDSMDFISFEDFTNQLEFANVSREMNNRIKSSVLEAFGRENLAGTRVRFTGVFQWVEGKGIVITPVELDRGE